MTATKNYTDAQLTEGILGRREAAYAALYQRYGDMVIGHVRKNSGNPEDAREIMQITMVKLYQAIRDGRYEDRGKLGHYVFQLAANSWREELRRRRARPRGSLETEDGLLQLPDEGDEALAATVVKDERLRVLHRALRQMGSPCKEIINGYHLRRRKLKEMAVELSYDYNALRKRLFDCRGRLRRATEALLATK